MVADTGDAKGTAINSERQLWSVAGNLAMVYRVLFGMNFAEEGLRFHPVIPKPLGGSWDWLDNFRYRAAVLKIHVEGYGSRIATIARSMGSRFPTRCCRRELQVHMRFASRWMNTRPRPAKLNLVDAAVSPDTPETWWGLVDHLGDNQNLYTKPVDGLRYMAFQNGRPLDMQGNSAVNIRPDQINSEFQVLGIDTEGRRSFLVEPLPFFAAGQELTVPALPRPIDITRTANTKVTFQAALAQAGHYAIDFHYANGSGPINTDNKCAIRTLSVDGKQLGPIVLPAARQRRLEELWL